MVSGTCMYVRTWAHVHCMTSDLCPPAVPSTGTLQNSFAAGCGVRFELATRGVVCLVNMGKIRAKKRCKMHMKSQVDEPPRPTSTRMEECVCFLWKLLYE